MPQPFRTSRRVEFRDTDAAGIVHFSVFPVYMEQAEHELLRSLGMSVHHRDADGEISWPRVSVGCDYLAALRFEDLVDIEVTLARLGSKSVRWEFAFSCQGRPVARGQMTVVCCRMVRDRPPESIPIPAPIAEKLQALVR